MAIQHRPAFALRQPNRLLAAAIAGAIATFGAAPQAYAQTAQSAPEGALEEVVVTARKREESLQTTPISVTAFTGQALAERGIDTTKDLGAFTPNLVANNGSSVSGNNSAGSFFIRGIGQIDFTLNTDPGVGLYVDEVYIARAIGSVMELLDLAGVEVLRGPQGTLFGRNTIGGAILLRSEPPADEFGADVELELGSDNLRRGKVSANLPVSDTFLTRVSASYTQRDGFVRRIADGIELGDTDALAARFAARWIPSDTVTADLVFDGSRHREESPPTIATALDGTSQFGQFHNAVIAGPQCLPPPGSLTNPACFNSQFLTGNSYSTHGTQRSQSDLDAWGGSLTVAVEPSDALRFKSITAYRNTEAIGFRDGDSTPHTISQTEDTWDHDQFSQELQIAGTQLAGALDWIVGLYYFEEQGTNINLVNFAPIFIQSGGSVDNDSTALFGQATWRATDALSVTAGLRYTDETKRFDPDQFLIEDRNPDPAQRLPPGTPLVPPVEVATAITETTPYLNLAYQWTDDVMTYATYSEGFKSGGFTQRVFPPLPATPSFRPEFVKSYEVGAKVTALDQRLRFNAAAFFTDYTDLQVLALIGPAPTTQNAAQAEIRGFEVELTARPVAQLSLEAAVGYVDAEYTAIGAQVIGLSVDSKFAQIPEWTGSAAVAYRFDLGSGAQLTPRVDWSYHSDVFMDALNTRPEFQPAYDLLSASLTWRSAGDHWQVRLAGTNLTDERYFTAGFADLPVAGVAEVVLARPRSWSLQLQYQY
jgi:iron complex outermembrane receptor protein